MKKDPNQKNKHWEMTYSPSVRKDKKGEVGASFNPMPAKERTKTYKPINDQDT